MSTLHFVTGKGGVGKTWVSKALHSQKSDSKLISTLNYSRSQLAQDFVLRTIKIKLIASWLGQSQLFQTLLSLAPNLNELLLLHRLLEDSKAKPLIVDAPSTGNFIAIFEALRTAREIFDGGSLKSLSEEICEQINRPDHIFVHLVTLPENSSLEESQQIRDYLGKYFPRIQCEFILNRKHQKPLEGSCPEPWYTLGVKRFDLETARQSQSKILFSQIFEESHP